MNVIPCCKTFQGARIWAFWQVGRWNACKLFSPGVRRFRRNFTFSYLPPSISRQSSRKHKQVWGKPGVGAKPNLIGRSGINLKVQLGKKRNAEVSRTFKGQLQYENEIKKKMTGIASVAQNTIPAEILHQSEAMYPNNTDFKDATVQSLVGGKRVSF